MIKMTDKIYAEDDVYNMMRAVMVLQDETDRLGRFVIQSVQPSSAHLVSVAKGLSKSKKDYLDALQVYREVVPENFRERLNLENTTDPSLERIARGEPVSFHG
jgi:2-iminoacetate synthase ThiH